MTSESYEGWANRETWCTNLWLSNDEGTYHATRDLARDAWRDAADEDDWNGLFTWEDIARRLLADRLKDQFEELQERLQEAPQELTHDARVMLIDIGSLYRVDWHEVAAHWVADIREEVGAE